MFLVTVVHLNVWFLVLVTVGLRILPLHSVFSVLFVLKVRLDISQFFSLLELEHFGIDVLYRGLHVGHTGSGHCDGARGEDLQSGLRALYLVGDTWVKLGLV